MKKQPGRTGMKKRVDGKLYYRWRNNDGILGGWVHENVIAPRPGNVYVSDGVFVHGGTIWGGEIEENVLVIMGSRYTLTAPSKPGHICIGCEVHTVKHWLKNYKEIGKDNSFTDNQITEYHDYINLAANWLKKHDSKDEVSHD